MDFISVKTLGTGAADHEWSRIGDADVRGSATTLIDNKIMIDCGVTGIANLTRAGIDPKDIEVLMITHSHVDHCKIEEIDKLLNLCGKEIKIIADKWIIEEIAKVNSNFVASPLACGNETTLYDDITVLALPANHEVSGQDIPRHYLFKTNCGNLLYALDGAWMIRQARKFIGQTKLDMIIWDATMSQAGNWRIFEHNDVTMVNTMFQVFKTDGIANENTQVILTHMARTLWPEFQEDCQAIADEYGFTAAFDGAEFELKRA
jgi:phosphoribosyl 1,2-cyclic phosphodiesterase